MTSSVRKTSFTIGQGVSQGPSCQPNVSWLRTRSRLSTVLRKTAFKLILISPKYSDTSLYPTWGDQTDNSVNSRVTTSNWDRLICFFSKWSRHWHCLLWDQWVFTQGITLINVNLRYCVSFSLGDCGVNLVGPIHMSSERPTPVDRCAWTWTTNPEGTRSHLCRCSAKRQGPFLVSHPTWSGWVDFKSWDSVVGVIILVVLITILGLTDHVSDDLGIRK